MHYHLRITDARTGDVRHAQHATVWWEPLEPERAAATARAELVAALSGRLDGDDVVWTDPDGDERRRAVLVVECDEPLELRAASVGADSA